ncbi:hypothetical protein LCGC14_0388260 [marine sediment metagenome]|uniref:DNA methylase N-4/N-6 domain-containing protein n=1 Tax=marine sediment metagenome TaxID=412755 RepID=A0A0F9T5W0_9ZZZZ
MIINRVWAMPNKWTFEIPPIKKLIYKYGGDFKGWIDPFAGMNSPAEITNDINPEMPAHHNLEARDFINLLPGEYQGCLFDPPYTLRQIFECYKGHGKEEMITKDPSGAYSQLKIAIAKKILPGGHTIHFGYHSNGFGKKMGFKIVEILLVAHGRTHYDTIVTVEQKFQDTLF